MEDLLIELNHLNQIHNDGNWTRKKDDSCIVIVFFIEPQAHTEEQEHIESTKQLTD